MSTKPAVRARKLEIGKRLRVFRLEELQDADEALIGRTFIPVITGVEKEEEEVRSPIWHFDRVDSTYGVFVVFAFNSNYGGAYFDLSNDVLYYGMRRRYPMLAYVLSVSVICAPIFLRGSDRVLHFLIPSRNTTCKP